MFACACTSSCVQHVFRYGLIACNQAYPCADEEANLYGFHGVFSSHSIQLAELQLSTATLAAYAKQVLLVLHSTTCCTMPQSCCAAAIAVVRGISSQSVAVCCGMVCCVVVFHAAAQHGLLHCSTLRGMLCSGASCRCTAWSIALQHVALRRNVLRAVLPNTHNAWAPRSGAP